MTHIARRISLALGSILAAVAFTAASCGPPHDPCQGHGGTVGINKGIYTCKDGTVV